MDSVWRERKVPADINKHKFYKVYIYLFSIKSISQNLTSRHVTTTRVSWNQTIANLVKYSFKTPVLYSNLHNKNKNAHNLHQLYSNKQLYTVLDLICNTQMYLGQTYRENKENKKLKLKPTLITAYCYCKQSLLMSLTIFRHISSWFPVPSINSGKRRKIKMQVLLLENIVLSSHSKLTC